MGCSGCSSGRGCGNLPAGCNNNGSCGTGGCNKLNVFDWLAGMERPGVHQKSDLVEVRFKNARKDYFRRSNIILQMGDVVAVEAYSGHDVGIVSLAGELVRLQMNRKQHLRKEQQEIRKIYRKARQSDIDTWQEAQKIEVDTMLIARKIAADLYLEMKISDVEYQGDKTKATFFYTAEERVDFRQLIKVLADRFKVRVEMRQIGARQEAGRLGGIGSCGMELCCSTWLTDFRSVATSAVRYQQLALNPVKLAGQCGKLKCCLNYELDVYLEALKEFPKSDVRIETNKGKAKHQKTDIFKRLVWYAYEDDPLTLIPIPLGQVKKMLTMNKEGKKPHDLKEYTEVVEDKQPAFENVAGQDSITRFDKRKGRRRKRKGNRKKRR